MTTSDQSQRVTTSDQSQRRSSIAHALLARSFLRSRLQPQTLRSRAALETFQARHVLAHLDWARARSRDLAKRFAGRPTSAWRSLAPTDKAAMMASWDDVVTVPVRRDEAMEIALRAERERDFSPTLRGYTVGLSSGTSGNRGLFVASPEERAEWAGAAIARVLPDWLPGLRAHRVAFFLRANSNLYESVGSRRIAFRFFDLADDFSAHLTGLSAQRPTVLLAPPSMLRLLAEATLRGDLALAPTVVVSVAEVLDPVDEGLIRRAFGRVVRQVYQATEGFLGSSCEYGTVHLAEDVAVFERELVAGSAEGAFQPIVTDFRRRSQPIVRYRLDDVLVPRRSPCPCGRVTTALDRIEGRADDLFLLGAARAPLFPDFVRRAVMLADARIDDYRVRQLAPDALTLWVAPDDAYPAAHGALVALCRARGATVSVTRGEAPLREPLRKLRRVERAFA